MVGRDAGTANIALTRNSLEPFIGGLNSEKLAWRLESRELLITKLQRMGTEPAIDMTAYAAWLKG